MKHNFRSSGTKFERPCNKERLQSVQNFRPSELEFYLTWNNLKLLVDNFFGQGVIKL